MKYYYLPGMGPGAEYTEMNKKLYVFVTVSVSLFNSQASRICRLVNNVFSLYLCFLYILLLPATIGTVLEVIEMQFKLG